MKFNQIVKYADMVITSIDILTTLGEKIDVIEDFKRKVEESSLFINNKKELDDKELRYIENIYKIINILNEDKDNKNDIIVLAVTITGALIGLPVISAAGYISYKGYKGCKHIKEKCAKIDNDIRTFEHLYHELGFDDRMNDLLYNPTKDEVELLKTEFKVRTNGKDLITVLNNYVNKIK